MDSGHEHFQQLAVGHVLGGLTPEDAAQFRSHLLGCRDCRARVAELRGIASDLERAERDERARAVVQTEVAEPADEGDAPSTRRSPGTAPSRVGVRHVTVAALVVLVLAGAMAFWNLHLRSSTAMLSTVAEQHAQTLEVLATGLAVEVEAEHPVRGVAAIDGDHVAVTLAGVAQPEEGERVVAWLHDEEGVTAVAELRTRAAEGSVAVVLEDQDADRLELTLERGELGEEPEGDSLAHVGLREPAGDQARD